MGGKSLQKYFHDDAWPLVCDLFERLHISETKGFELFKTFAKIDANENGLVEIDECFRYIGGNRTKFTERIFYHVDCLDEFGRKVYGLKFKQFSIVLWSYCTLTHAGLARFVFEIFDVENNETIEKAVVDAIYRMLCNAPECDERYLAVYEFDDEKRIAKSDFMEISAKYKVLIQPAIDYQNRLRKCLGGQYMWDSLMNYRKKHFSVHDTQCDTLSDALESIIRISDTTKRKVVTAEEVLEENKKKLALDTELAERELKLREKQLANERRLQEMTAEDRKMTEAWRAFDSARDFFASEEFLLDDAWRRHELRSELYDLFDAAVEACKEYWEWRVRKDIQVTEGTDADHEARYRDYLSTEEGRKLHEFYSLYYLFERLEESIRAKNAKNKRYSEQKKGERQMTVETTLQDLQKTLNGILDLTLPPKDREKKLLAVRYRVFEDEAKAARKYAKSAERAEAEERAHRELSRQVRAQTMKELRERVEAESEERRKEYIRKAFDIATSFGSRITRYQLLLVFSVCIDLH